MKPVSGKGQDHAPLGKARNTAFSSARSAHKVGLHLRRNLPEARQGGGAGHALVRHPRNDPASGRNRPAGRSRRARHPHHHGSDRLAHVQQSRRARKHHHLAQPRRKPLALHARQLALKPHLQILRRHCRSLLRCLAKARKPALAHHVYRAQRMDKWVLISDRPYKAWDYLLFRNARSKPGRLGAR